MVEWGIISTVLILTVLVIRRCCKGKIPHGIIYGLWLVVLLRLLVPVTPVESSFSILNYLPKQWEEQGFDEKVVKGNNGERNVYDALAVPDLKMVYNTEKVQQNFSSGDKGENKIENNVSLPEYFMADTVPVSANDFGSTIPKQNAQTHEASMFLYYIWFAGAAIMAVFLVVINLNFYIRIKKNAVPIGRYGKLGVYDTQEVVSPCLFGVFVPSVYLDSTKITSGTVKEHILLHEATHYRHRDHIWSVLRGVAVCLHWYNPIVWYAAYVSEKDCEIACDESVIKKLGEQNRISYGETLLEMICRSRRISNVMCTATTMVGTKKGIKERIKSVAQKKHFSKAAFLFLAVSALVVTACTFTGKESNAEEKALIKEAKEHLFENKSYDKTMNCRFCPGDYDMDGQKEVFLFVRTDEDSVDVLYYDEGELTEYRTEKNLHDLEKDIYVMELSDKTFCVYDKTTDTKTVSKVLGIRDGQIANYFMDYQSEWENEKYIEGQVGDFQGNSVDVITYNHVAERTDSEETDCAMTEYFYYDKAKDIFNRYPVYAITKEEVLSMKGGEETFSRFRESFDGDSNHFSFAECNGRVILMGNAFYQEDSRWVYQYSVYDYNKKENRLGECILMGNGNYENLDAGSQRTVSLYEQDKVNAIYRLVSEYEKGITCDGTILEHSEWLEEETAYIRTCEWTNDNEILMHITELTAVYENGEARLSEKTPVKTTYHEIKNKEEFNRAYLESYGTDIAIPDLFLYNIQAEIAEKNIEKYRDPQSAFYAYFHVSGGQMREVTTRNNFGLEIAGITYEFADKETVSVELYKDYQGVWAVYTGAAQTGYETNQWYAMLTNEDLKNAVPMEDFSFSMLDSNENLVLTEHIGPNEDIYFSGRGYSGMALKNGDEITLLPISYDLMNFPEFFAGDYDKDGVTEHAVINCTGRGTGFFTQDISVIETLRKPYDRAYQINTWDIMAIIDDKLDIRYDKEKGRIALELDTENENAAFELSVYSFLDELKKSGESGEMGSITYGDIGYMSCEDGVFYCDMLLQYVPYGWVTGTSLSEISGAAEQWEWVRVKMRYAGNGEFVLEDIFFTAEE